MKLRLALLTLGLPLSLFACGSSDPGPAGGIVSGAEDLHCATDGGMRIQTIGMCLMGEQPADGGTSDDAGAPSSGIDDYGPALYNAKGFDDDCKYAVVFTNTPIHRNEDETFTLKATRLDTGAAVKGANIITDVTLGDTHASSVISTSTEGLDGTYVLSHIVFDRPGRWTVRFHLFQDCNDGEDSPHGHVAFYIDVP